MSLKNRCLIAALLLVLLAGQASAIEVFVWHHDNGLRVIDPIYNQSYTATQPIYRALNDLDNPWDSSTVLPNDLSQYDVVITCLAFYCPG
jgi:hypothetical protein